MSWDFRSQFLSRRFVVAPRVVLKLDSFGGLFENWVPFAGDSDATALWAYRRRWITISAWEKSIVDTVEENRVLLHQNTYLQQSVSLVSVTCIFYVFKKRAVLTWWVGRPHLRRATITLKDITVTSLLQDPLLPAHRKRKIIRLYQIPDPIPQELYISIFNLGRQQLSL